MLNYIDRWYRVYHVDDSITGKLTMRPADWEDNCYWQEYENRAGYQPIGSDASEQDPLLRLGGHPLTTSPVVDQVAQVWPVDIDDYAHDDPADLGAYDSENGTQQNRDMNMIDFGINILG